MQGLVSVVGCALLGAWIAQGAFTVGYRWAHRSGWALDALRLRPSREGAQCGPCVAPSTRFSYRTVLLRSSYCVACGAVLPWVSALPLVGVLGRCRCGSRGGAAPFLGELVGACLVASSLGAPASFAPAWALVLVVLWSVAAAIERCAAAVPAALLALLLALCLVAPVVVRAPAVLSGACVVVLVLFCARSVLHVRRLNASIAFHEWVAACACGALLGPVLGAFALGVAVLGLRLRPGYPGLLGPLGLAAGAIIVTLWLSPPAYIVRLPLGATFPWLVN